MRLFYILIITLGFLVGSASAQGGGPTDDEVNAIAKNLYCPVCENVPLDVCPTTACKQWRQQIADKLADGWSEEEIYDFFVLQYGDRVLASPPARGLNWLIYILPPLALFLGATALYRMLSRSREVAAHEPSLPRGKPNNDYIRRIEDELETRR